MIGKRTMRIVDMISFSSGFDKITRSMNYRRKGSMTDIMERNKR